MVSFLRAWSLIANHKTELCADCLGVLPAGEDASTTPAKEAVHLLSVSEVAHVKTKLQEVRSRGRFLSCGFTRRSSSFVPAFQRCLSHSQISVELSNILTWCPGMKPQTQRACCWRVRRQRNEHEEHSPVPYPLPDLNSAA